MRLVVGSVADDAGIKKFFLAIKLGCVVVVECILLPFRRALRVSTIDNCLMGIDLHQVLT